MRFPEALLQAARDAYAQPPRAYHGFSHAEDVLRHVADVAAGPGWLQPNEVHLAALFHDAVYHPGAADNEARSADLAASAIAAWLPDAGIDTPRVRHLILLTARHGALQPHDVDADADAALFLDCDMAILGATPARFDAYDAAIAIEYRDVLPPDAFRHARRRFLQRLLDAPRIFLSDFFHARLDAAARDNLHRTLAA